MTANLPEFNRLLKSRGLNITRLAKSAGCGRSHLSQVLNGTRPGGPTRRKLEPILPDEELIALGWKPTWHDELWAGLEREFWFRMLVQARAPRLKMGYAAQLAQANGGLPA